MVNRVEPQPEPALRRREGSFRSAPTRIAAPVQLIPLLNGGDECVAFVRQQFAKKPKRCLLLRMEGVPALLDLCENPALLAEVEADNIDGFEPKARGIACAAVGTLGLLH